MHAPIKTPSVYARQALIIIYIVRSQAPEVFEPSGLWDCHDSSGKLNKKRPSTFEWYRGQGFGVKNVTVYNFRKLSLLANEVSMQRDRFM